MARIFLGLIAQLILWYNSQSQVKLTEPPTSKMFSKEIAVFDSLNRLQIYQGDAILFTGSSSIKLWKTMEEDLPGFHCVNRGFGGARIEDLAFFLPQILSIHPWRAIVIMAGSNNIAGGPNDTPIDSIILYTRYIIDNIKLARPGIPIFWIAITPTLSRISVIDKVRRMNETWKTEFAQSNTVKFIDTFDRFIDAEGKPLSDLFINDRLHLNRAGYRIWGEVISEVLSSNLRQ